MVTGRTPFLSSSIAKSMGLVTPSGGVMRSGAPSAICKARAPIILASSNRVSFNGPTTVIAQPPLDMSRALFSMHRHFKISEHHSFD